MCIYRCKGTFLTPVGTLTIFSLLSLVLFPPRKAQVNPTKQFKHLKKAQVTKPDNFAKVKLGRYGNLTFLLVSDMPLELFKFQQKDGYMHQMT